MKKILLVSCAALSLSGCTTLLKVGQEICDRQVQARAALLVALEAADSETKRIAIRASLDALEECPDVAR